MSRYYKVVRAVGEEYHSAIEIADRLKYKIGEKTIAKIGGIFVFNHWFEANSFINGTNLIVLIVEVDPKEEIKEFPHDNALMSAKERWDRRSRKEKYAYPTGTRLFKSVTPIKMIGRNYCEK